MTDLINGKHAVDFFVSHLSQNLYPNLKIDQRPEDTNRNSREIDAIAGPFAIEHTSIDTILNQRRDAVWFSKALGNLEAEISNKIAYRLNITIPYEGIQVGQNWDEIRNSLKTWIINISPTIVDGMHIIRNADGIPFEFMVNKASGRRPGLFLARFIPKDDPFPERIYLQLTNKAQKLEPYKKKGYITILLVESGDIALMNEGIMLDSISLSFSNYLPVGVDQLWYMDTSITDEILFYNFTQYLSER